MLVPVVVFLSLTLAVLLTGMIVLRGEPADDESRFRLAPSPLARAFSQILPTSERARDRMRRELVQAGFFRSHSYEIFTATRNAAVLLWVMFVAGLLVLSTRLQIANPARLGLVGLVGLIVLFALPGVVLSLMAESRRKRVYHGLPDALDMLTMMMTGGLGLDRSLARAAVELRSAHPDLATELAIVHRQAAMGSFGKSMQSFAERMDDPEITGLSTLVRHSEKLGSPIGDALVEYSDSVRRSRRQRAEERGNKRNVMLLFPVVLFLAPPIYILLLGPAMLELRDFLNRDSSQMATVSRPAQSPSGDNGVS